MIKLNNNNNILYYDAKLTITIFSAYMAIILSCAYFLLRVGFPNPITSVLNVLSISLYFICFPSFYRLMRRSYRGSGNIPLITTDAFVSLGNLLVIISIAYFSSAFPFNIFPFLGTLGIIIFLILFITWLGKGSWKHSIAFLIISTIFSLLMAAHIWQSDYVNPLYVENIVLDTSHIDTLYHAAIAGMIKTYGIPSTGLDGVPFRAYHCGSHWLFAQLSKLLNLRVIDFYQLGYPVIFIPWLLQCMLFFAVDLKQNFYKNMMPGIDLRRNLLLWIVLLLLLLECTPVSELAMRYGIHTVSQSYMVSLMFAFLFLSIGLILITNSKKLEGYFWQIATFILIIPGLICFTTFTKVSVGVLLLCIYMYMLFRIKCFKNYLPVISLIITLLFIIPVIFIIGSGQLGLKIVPFNLIINSDLHLFFIFFHYVLSWLFIAYRLYETHSVTVKEFINNVKTNQMLDVEVIALLCFASLVPFLIFQDRGGGEFYFTDVQNVVVISFLLANWAKIQSLIRNWISQIKFTSRTKIRDIVVAFIVVCFVVESIFLYITPLKSLIKSNLSTRIAYYYMSIGYDGGNKKDFTEIARNYLKLKGLTINYHIIGGAFNKLIDAVKNDLIIINSSNIKDVRVKLIYNIYDLGMMGAAEKKKTAIFIPHSNKVYWNLSSDMYKRKAPFVVPAITEIALIKGLPIGLSEQEIKSMGYGYMGYKFPQKPQEVEDTLDKICQEAMLKGFSQLIVVDGKNQEYKIVLADYLKMKHKSNTIQP